MKLKKQFDIRRIKELTVIALFSDDELMDHLLLKGGSAIELVYNLDARSSIDLDFSMAASFPSDDLTEVKERIMSSLLKTFADEGLVPFDVDLREKPPAVTEDVKDFWGGYKLEFKLIEKNRASEIAKDIAGARRSAAIVGPRQKRKVEVDISRFEYLGDKRTVQIHGYSISAYSPAMLVMEKLRAICQQMEEYSVQVPSPSRRPRAKDFFDIHLLANHFKIDFTSPENLELLAKVFDAKRTPLALLGKIAGYREYHRADFVSVQDTVNKKVKLREFDFYFDFVVKLAQKLKALGEK